MPTLTVDELEFEVRQSPRRRTLQITVDRSGDLLLSAPHGVTPEVMEEFVREKRFWIYSKLAEKEVFRRPNVLKEFVSGEAFPYLGRSYRLLLVADQDLPLKLDHGRFRLIRQHRSEARRHFIEWYSRQGKAWLTRRVDRFAARMRAHPYGLEVRDLGNRWGSCGKGRVVNFHWATILLPPRIIDYIIVHELAHLIVDNHTPGFWQRVERVLPDFAERRRWLAENGAAFGLA
jgi:predicted metal-dependent hydrolase